MVPARDWLVCFERASRGLSLSSVGRKPSQLQVLPTPWQLIRPSSIKKRLRFDRKPSFRSKRIPQKGLPGFGGPVPAWVLQLLRFPGEGALAIDYWPRVCNCAHSIRTAGHANTKLKLKEAQQAADKTDNLTTKSSSTAGCHSASCCQIDPGHTRNLPQGLCQLPKRGLPKMPSSQQE